MAKGDPNRTTRQVIEKSAEQTFVRWGGVGRVGGGGIGKALGDQWPKASGWDHLEGLATEYLRLAWRQRTTGYQRRVILTVAGTKDEALAACKAHGLSPSNPHEVIEDHADSATIVPVSFYGQSLKRAAEWLQESDGEPVAPGVLLALDADIRKDSDELVNP